MENDITPITKRNGKHEKTPQPVDFQVMSLPRQNGMAEAVLAVVWDEDEAVFRFSPCLMVLPSAQALAVPGKPVSVLRIPFSTGGTLSPQMIRKEISKLA